MSAAVGLSTILIGIMAITLTAMSLQMAKRQEELGRRQTDIAVRQAEIAEKQYRILEAQLQKAAALNVFVRDGLYRGGDKDVVYAVEIGATADALVEVPAQQLSVSFGTTEQHVRVTCQKTREQGKVHDIETSGSNPQNVKLTWYYHFILEDEVVLPVRGELILLYCLVRSSNPGAITRESILQVGWSIDTPDFRRHASGEKPYTIPFGDRRAKGNWPWWEK